MKTKQLILLFIFIIFMFNYACIPLQKGRLLSSPVITELPDKSLLYSFQSGVTCKKTPDYTKYINTGGKAQIKEIFEASGNYESKWQSIKVINPTFGMIDATFFDICFDYGQGLIDKVKYDEKREVYEKIREDMFKEEGKLKDIKSMPEIKKPMFSENIKYYRFSLGGRGINIGYEKEVLENGHMNNILVIGNYRPFELYIEEGKLYADVKIYGGKGRPPIEIKKNKLSNKPPDWDFNSNETALEIVDNNYSPIYQFIYKTPSHIVINGIFPIPDSFILACDSGTTSSSIVPTNFSLKRIFKYPSWKHPGKYE
ncbi:MAG: hypothetical protein AB1499_09175 [Nitrospirota bacterium]